MEVGMCAFSDQTHKSRLCLHSISLSFNVKHWRVASSSFVGRLDNLWCFWLLTLSLLLVSLSSSSQFIAPHTLYQIQISSRCYLYIGCFAFQLLILSSSILIRWLYVILPIIYKSVVCAGSEVPYGESIKYTSNSNWNCNYTQICASWKLGKFLTLVGDPQLNRSSNMS